MNRNIVKARPTNFENDSALGMEIKTSLTVYSGLDFLRLNHVNVFAPVASKTFPLSVITYAFILIICARLLTPWKRTEYFM